MTGRTTLAVTCGLLVSAGASADDIATNGGFELGTGGDSANWVEFGGGAMGTFSERTMNMPISGMWSHQIFAMGDATTGGSAGINQNSIVDGGLASLQENTMLSLSFDAVTNFGPGGVGFYTLRILDGSGAIVADTGLQPIVGGLNQSAALNVPAFGTAPADTYAAFAEFVVNAGAFQGSFAGARIDNVVIEGTLVPTPGTLALLGLGGLAMTRRRR